MILDDFGHMTVCKKSHRESGDFKLVDGAENAACCSVKRVGTFCVQEVRNAAFFTIKGLLAWCSWGRVGTTVK